MNQWPFRDFPVYEDICECGFHKLRPKEGGENYCYNVMCKHCKPAPKKDDG